MIVKFDGHDLTKLFTVGNVRRPLPEFVTSSSEVEGRDGKLFDGQVIGTRSVYFDLIANATTDRELQDTARKLLGILSVRKPAKLTFSDERDGENTQLVRYAVPTGAFDSEEFRRLGKWSCEFVQLDPFLYGKSRKATIPAGKTLKVDVGGNAPAYITAKASHVSGTAYTLSRANGPHVTYLATFSGSHKVAIDMSGQTVRVSPTISGAEGIRLGSRFFAIEGTVTLGATAATEIEWRERWL